MSNIKIKVNNWSWWDTHASDVHTWLDKNTEYGTTGCRGKFIHFKNSSELLWFRLKWGIICEDNTIN